jgi:V/A-type H+-transporting ATPase subunit I
MNKPWLRPRAARWFELLVARDDTTLALEALAATGAVEIETHGGDSLPGAFADLTPLLQQHAELAQRYGAFWPRDGLKPSALPETSKHALQAGLDRIHAWAAQAEPLVLRLQRARAAREPLRLWHAAVAPLDGGPINLARLASAGPQMQVRLAVLPPGSDMPVAPPGLLVRAFEIDGAPSLLSLGTAAQQLALEVQVGALKGQWLPAPAQVDALADANEAQRRLQALEIEAMQARVDIDALSEAHGLREALANAQRLQWVVDNVRSLSTGPLFTWITGWTSADDAAALDRAIEASGARALLRLADPPADALAPPMLLSNPPWARPFEVFARAMGVPSGTEADPSRLLAIAVPLLFGYMFGDLGQGLVIAAAGFALRKRFRIARLFIAGGLAAAVFGLMFGSVFGLHLMTPWWLAPLDEPLTVLLVPLAGGAVLLTLGLVLSAAEAHWRGQLGAWLATDGGLLLCYLGLLLALVWPGPIALAIAAAGALLYCGGHAARQRRALAAAAALGELVERLMQLLINTLSFARVGAFALAHAGLSSAILALMHAAGHPLAAGMVLVIGNVVVMLLEGLVVSIQTTRLVLFEFFTRFLQAQGRVFRPLPPPPSALQENPQ